MRRHLRRRPPADDVNLTPMLDVTFILLIFFVVTASFVRESGVEVDRPTAATAAPHERATILVGVAATGEIWLDGHPVDVRAVRARLARAHATDPQGRVVIDADRRAETGTVLHVLDAARLAGFDDVAIAAEAP